MFLLQIHNNVLECLSERLIVGSWVVASQLHRRLRYLFCLVWFGLVLIQFTRALIRAVVEVTCYKMQHCWVTHISPELSTQHLWEMWSKRKDLWLSKRTVHSKETVWPLYTTQSLGKCSSLVKQRDVKCFFWFSDQIGCELEASER